MVEIEGKKFIPVHRDSSEYALCSGCVFYDHKTINCEDHDELVCGAVVDGGTVYKEAE